MKILKNAQKVKAFWQALEAAKKRRLLMLDYDGTLSPFVADRANAYPYPGIGRLLGRIISISLNTVVIISGRNALEVKKLLGLRVPVEIWGGHGMERLLPSGRLIQVPIGEESKDIFNRVENWAKRHGLEGSMEEKHGSIAFHVRGLGRKKAETILEETTEYLEDVSEDTNLEVDAFDGGVELRTVGIDKGTVVDKLLQSFEDDVICSYYGDDFTDEDAFKALNGRGVSFLVRSELRQTHADVWIIPPDELKRCLSRYILDK